ncbi:unnamed protein product, partial [Owenia fusiformis]
NEHKAYLELLAKTKSKSQRSALIRTIYPGQLKALMELILNVLAGNVIISRKERMDLLKFRATLEFMADTDIPNKQKIQRLLKKSKGIVVLLNIALMKALALL